MTVNQLLEELRILSDEGLGESEVFVASDNSDDFRGLSVTQVVEEEFPIGQKFIHVYTE